MRVIILGSGKVASSLGAALRKKGCTISGVYSRNQFSGLELCKKFNCKLYTNIASIPTTCNLYLLTVNDNSIVSVASQISHVRGIVAHTSGSVPMSDLGRATQTGVLYPLQTITGRTNMSFRNVPLCIEASDKGTLKRLKQIAENLSEHTVVMDSKTRETLHLAAVFANNFTNYILGTAFDVVKDSNLDKKLLYPLVYSTLQNAFNRDPKLIQTGPAARNDSKTIAKHLKLLKSNPAAYELYTTITNQIKNQTHNHHL